MARLSQRLADLERRLPAGAKTWHRILQYDGQTQEEALAVYEAENGPIGPDDGAILRVIIQKPFPTPMLGGAKDAGLVNPIAGP